MRGLAFLALALVVVQIALGGTVRLTGSGLSCPDWPLCHGLWLPLPSALAEIPDLAYEPWQVLLEWGHRMNAAFLVAPVVTLLFIAAWPRRGRARMLALASVLLVVAQAFLGGVTVLEGNSPGSVAGHLVLALVLVATLVGTAAGTRAPAAAGAHILEDRPERAAGVRQVRAGRGAGMPTGIAAVAWAGLAFAIAASASGAFMAKTGASQACPGWPFCDAWALPDFSEPGIHLHAAHRAAALAAALAALYLLLSARTLAATPALSWALLAGAAVLVQSALGALFVLGGFTLEAAVLHQVFGALTVAALAGVAWTGSGWH